MKCFPRLTLALLSIPLILSLAHASEPPASELDTEGYFKRPGLNFLVFNNWYDGAFSDAKISGVEIIQHGERVATNGDVRLSPTPSQWSPIPTFTDRSINAESGTVVANLSYPAYDFEYSIQVKAEDKGFLVSILSPKPLPKALEGKAGFNFEFLPSKYFEEHYLVDGAPETFPLYPASNMEKGPDDLWEPAPLASGKQLVLAPGSDERRISIVSKSGQELSLYDGRNQAQNGCFVVRSLLPAGKSGTLLEWYVEPSTLPNWVRKPMIAFSQVGYHPAEEKVAVIELDTRDEPQATAKLLRVAPDGSTTVALDKSLEDAGTYLRYHYYRFDFSTIVEPGLYRIAYGDQLTGTFEITSDIYADAWHPTSDIYFPVQMDHMLVNEAYRVWHGASHMDDALQAPINHEHFDLYGQGPTTDTPYQPGEHIPGLNVGGWYDAGDYDIRTQTQYAVVTNLVQLIEDYGVTRDETTIDWEARHVEIHQPDGQDDILQQIKHGALALLAQHKAVGHAIPGIVAAHLDQYTHLGDGSTKTDNLIYDPSLDELESDGFHSGKFDDRWAFTSHTTALNYGSAAALAAASRVLGDIDQELADECLQTALNVWVYEHTHEPATFHVGNTTGGKIEHEQIKAAVELWLATSDNTYLQTLEDYAPEELIDYAFTTPYFLRVYQELSPETQQRVHDSVLQMDKFFKPMVTENPFGVPITRRGWAGNGFVVAYGLSQYQLHKRFPDEFDGSGAIRSLHYLYGCHPAHNLSFVSAVGAKSKRVAYGNNRADFSFIAGGVVPGILVINPNFPENKEDWPFFWGQNEYVVNLASSYMLLVHAVEELDKGR